jgi:MFS family permease
MAPSKTRKALRLASANGFLWAIGNGLATTSLVIYLALELGASNLQISLIIAAAPLVGLLRQFTPLVAGRIVSRKSFCIRAYLASAVVLVSLPAVCQPSWSAPSVAGLALLITLWSVYHLLEYVATVALWSWLGDAAPARVRGRFFGVRERWLTGGRIVGMLIASGFSFWWQITFPNESRWLGYASVAMLGAVAMVLAVIPLIKMPDFEKRSGAEATSLQQSLWQLIQPLADGPFFRLILFGSWLGVSAGLTQAAQYKYPIQVLGISLGVYLLARSLMYGCQSWISPSVGRWLDRFGAKRLMLLCSLIVATGPLFYFLATPQTWQWYLLAWASWIWFVGLNVGIVYLIQKFAGASRRTAYVAAYESCTGLAYGAGALAGGLLTDYFATLPAAFSYSFMAQFNLDHYSYIFLAGWVLRSAAALILLTVREPDSEVGN